MYFMVFSPSLIGGLFAAAPMTRGTARFRQRAAEKSPGARGVSGFGSGQLAQRPMRLEPAAKAQRRDPAGKARRIVGLDEGGAQRSGTFGDLKPLARHLAHEAGDGTFLLHADDAVVIAAHARIS